MITKQPTHLFINQEESFIKDKKRLNQKNREKGGRNWLLVFPIIENGFDVRNQQFWASVILPHGWPIANLPSIHACGSTFTMQRSMSCKKGGLINIRYDDLRNLTATLLSGVCHDVQVEVTLLLLTGE